MENDKTSFCAYQPLVDALNFLSAECSYINIFNPSKEDLFFIKAHRYLFELVIYLNS